MSEENNESAIVENLNAELAAIKSKNSELLNEAKAAKEAKRIADDAVASANEDAARAAGDSEALEKSLSDKFQKQMDQLKLEKEATQTQLHKLTVENTITSQLAKHDVLPAFHKPLTAMFNANQFDIQDGKASVDGKPLEDFIGEYLGTDDGKHFIAAKQNSGGNASGSTQINNGGFTKETFTRTEQSKLLKESPDEYKSVCESLGIKPAI